MTMNRLEERLLRARLARIRQLEDVLSELLSEFQSQMGTSDSGDGITATVYMALIGSEEIP